MATHMEHRRTLQMFWMALHSYSCQNHPTYSATCHNILPSSKLRYLLVPSLFRTCVLSLAFKLSVVVCKGVDISITSGDTSFKGVESERREMYSKLGWKGCVVSHAELVRSVFAEIGRFNMSR